MLKARRFFCLLAAFVTLAGCATREAPVARQPSPAVPSAPATPARRRVVLITGYEPFAGLETNTSWEVAKRLAGERVSGCEVVAVGLPVVWEEARAKLGAAIKKHEPEAVISTGVGWSGYIKVERVARNVRGPHKDNRGELPLAGEVEPGGPARRANAGPTSSDKPPGRDPDAPAGGADRRAAEGAWASRQTFGLRRRLPL